MSDRPSSLRMATPDDADEVLRLAYLMWENAGFRPADGPWQNEYHKQFGELVSSDFFRIYVMDHPDEPQHLIACGAATWQRLLPAGWLPKGRIGFLQWFSVEPEWQGRGIGQRLLETCRDWLVEQGCARIHLHSTPAGESLYERNGFEPSYFKNLWLTPSTSDSTE